MTGWVVSIETGIPLTHLWPHWKRRKQELPAEQVPSQESRDRLCLCSFPLVEPVWTSGVNWAVGAALRLEFMESHSGRWLCSSSHLSFKGRVCVLMANQASCFGMQIQWEIQTLRIWPLHITETSLLVPAIFGIQVLTTVEGLSRFLPSFSASLPLTAGTPSEYQDTMSPEMVRVTGCVVVGRRFSLQMSLIWLRGASQPRSFWVELGLQPELLNCPRRSARSVQRMHVYPPPPTAAPSLYRLEVSTEVGED